MNEPSEVWDDGGVAGVEFTLPSGGRVFVHRDGNRAQPVEDDWKEARALLSFIKAALSGGSWNTIVQAQSGGKPSELTLLGRPLVTSNVFASEGDIIFGSLGSKPLKVKDDS